MVANKVQISEENLKRHKDLLSHVAKNEVTCGKYWTEAAKTFDVELLADGYLSKGTRNYLPEIFTSASSEKFHWESFREYVSAEGTRFSLEKIVLHDDRIELNSRFFKASELWCEQLYYFDRIKKSVPEFRPKRVLEIGGGAGMMAAILSAELGAKVFILDLPEMLSVSSAFLLYSFPDKKILLPHETTEKTNLDDFDFVLLTTDQRNLLPDGHFDFALNIASFQEMDIGEVNSYFQLVNRCLGQDGYFFCSNRIRKMTKFFEYPWGELVGFDEIFTEIGKFRKLAMRGESTYVDRLWVRNQIGPSGNQFFSRSKRALRDFILSKSLHTPERKYWLMHDLHASVGYRVLRKMKALLKKS